MIKHPATQATRISDKSKGLLKAYLTRNSEFLKKTREKIEKNGIEDNQNRKEKE
jgi:hypothetical protein